jgi:hypothetical protein
MNLKEVSQQSMAIRNRYHFEKEQHDSIWSVEEDALAFLTDAGLIGRATMDDQGRQPSVDTVVLPSKIGEGVG